MIKKRIFLTFFVIFFFSFGFKTQSCRAENTELKNVYPNYALEFVGNDPWENFNRKIFIFNLKANKYVIRPINIVWASIIPQYGMDRIQSFYTNLSFPVRLVGTLVQKDFKSSGTETLRFLTNTTIGLAGLYDPASSKFKIEPRQEDVEQALAYYNIKKGPYLVLPIVAQGNVRDLGGALTDFFLNPCFYIAGPITAISAGVSIVNGTAYMQPIFKMADNYDDPYKVSKELYGIDKYIKNENLDRREILNEKTVSQPIIEINNISNKNRLKADIELNNYKSQGPFVDAMRTILFDNQNLNNSIWSDLSVWNKSFIKKIKTASVNIDQLHQNYKYRYVLQKDKTAPLAVIYPSIGEGIMSNESAVQAKILYDAGYSVLIMGSSFQWDFVKSMPQNYRPGLPYQDADYLRKATSKIITDLEIKKSFIFNKKIIVGTSFGGLTTLFIAAKEEKENTLGVSKYISINPPVDLFFALKQLDNYSLDWKNNPSDIKLKAAITAQKVIQVSQNVSNKSIKTKPETLPFSEDEAKLAIAYCMRQKLSDVVFAIENLSQSQKSGFYNSINNLSFYDYAQKYLITEQNKPIEQLDYETSLYSLAGFLKSSKNYKIYHSLDDCFTDTQQLSWLKEQTGNKSVFFSNGSHLGFLYRKEFLDNFKKEINNNNLLLHEGI